MARGGRTTIVRKLRLYLCLVEGGWRMGKMVRQTPEPDVSRLGPRAGGVLLPQDDGRNLTVLRSME